VQLSSELPFIGAIIGAIVEPRLITEVGPAGKSVRALGHDRTPSGFFV
jgi:hypothetical protein